MLDDPGDDDWAYVYSVDRFEKPLKPYLAKYWLPGIDLIWELQSKLGGGLFRILIRSGRIMKFAGVFGWRRDGALKTPKALLMKPSG